MSVKKILLIILAVVAAAAVYFVANRATRKIAGPSASPPTTTTAGEIADAYSENESSADGRFKGHQVTVTGEIDRAAEVVTVPIVDLKAPNGMVVHCSFAREDRPTLAPLKPGQSVTLTGIVDGLFGRTVIGIKNCKVK